MYLHTPISNPSPLTPPPPSRIGLLFGANEQLLTQHISGPIPSISYCISATRVGHGLGLGLRVIAWAPVCAENAVSNFATRAL